MINILVYKTQALRDAPSDADDMEKNIVSTLYVNRATVLHVSCNLLFLYVVDKAKEIFYGDCLARKKKRWLLFSGPY